MAADLLRLRVAAGTGRVGYPGHRSGGRGRPCRYSLQSEQLCESLLSAANGNIDKILDDFQPPSYDAAHRGLRLYFEAVDRRMDDLAGGVCQEACDALDDWGTCNDDRSGQHLRHTWYAPETFEESGGI